jgi:hypothetical protein
VTFHRAYQVLPGVHELKVQLKRANKAKNTAVRSPLPSFQFPAARVESREAECRHPTGRERTGSPTLQTLQDPILLLQWLCFLVAAFRTLVKVCPHPPAAAPLSPSDASGATHSLRTGARATGAGAAGAARRGGVGRDHTAHDELVPGCQDRPIRAQGGHLPPQGTQYNRTNWLLWFGVSAGWASPSSRGLWGDDALLENSLASLPPPLLQEPGHGARDRTYASVTVDVANFAPREGPVSSPSEFKVVLFQGDREIATHLHLTIQSQWLKVRRVSPSLETSALTFKPPLTTPAVGIVHPSLVIPPKLTSVCVQGDEEGSEYAPSISDASTSEAGTAYSEARWDEPRHAVASAPAPHALQVRTPL